MTPEDQAVYQFCEPHYGDLAQTWDEYQAYYRAQYGKAREHLATQTALDEQLMELQALAVAMEEAAAAIRKVCYQQVMRVKRANGEPPASRPTALARGERS